MSRIIFIVLLLSIARCLNAGPVEVDSVARAEQLWDSVEKQGKEIATMTAYSARLKKILTLAGALASNSADELPFRQKLDWGLVHAHWESIKLVEALDTLSHITQVEIRVDWQALAAAGLDQNIRVTCDVHDWSVYPAMHTILEGIAANVHLGFFPENHRIMVTTEEGATKHTWTKSYDLKALLPHNADMIEAREALGRLVMDTVAPDSWKDAGGVTGVLTFNGTKIVVTQTADNLRGVEHLLEELDADKQINLARATIDRQERAIVWLTTEIDSLKARCRSLGIRVPPRVDHAMALAIPDIQFVGRPLSKCFDALSGVSGQLIYVDWKALRAADIDANFPITLALRGKTLAGALRSLLNTACMEKPRLEYVMEGNRVAVSTVAELDKSTLTRAYNIRDILATYRNRDEAIEHLTRTMTSIIEPDSWRDAGGTLGSVRELQGMLIVTHSERVHVLIKAFLDSWRQVRKEMRK